MVFYNQNNEMACVLLILFFRFPSFRISFLLIINSIVFVIVNLKLLKKKNPINFIISFDFFSFFSVPYNRNSIGKAIIYSNWFALRCVLFCFVFQIFFSLSLPMNVHTIIRLPWPVSILSQCVHCALCQSHIEHKSWKIKLNNEKNIVNLFCWQTLIKLNIIRQHPSKQANTRVCSRSRSHVHSVFTNKPKNATQTNSRAIGNWGSSIENWILYCYRFSRFFQMIFILWYLRVIFFSFKYSLMRHAFGMIWYFINLNELRIQNR